MATDDGERWTMDDGDADDDDDDDGDDDDDAYSNAIITVTHVTAVSSPRSS